MKTKHGKGTALITKASNGIGLELYQADLSHFDQLKRALSESKAKEERLDLQAGVCGRCQNKNSVAQDINISTQEFNTFSAFVKL
ncbi:hypothetical protein [Paenibacillus luteus]|uniref:hypothetical protein n=1 Tax=Paenibacillus luteus TaxID=2545753 RepID=UPI001144598A|nr:hypothetical protein [Paenibacillus luteus]